MQKGILQPQVSYRWRVKFGLSAGLEKNVQESISSQIVSCNLDYTNKEIKLKVRQDAVTTWVHELIMHLAKDKCSVWIDSLDGHGNVAYALQFDSILKEHNFELNYEKHKDDELFAHHFLTFKFSTMTPYTNNEIISEIENNELEESS